MLATKALHMVVEKLDQFDGQDISKYLRMYKKEMELNEVLEREMIQMFELAVVPKIREHVKGLIEHFNEDWEEKLELLLEDKKVDEGLTTNWKDVEDAVGLIAKRERRREKITIRRFAPKLASTHVLATPVPIVQPGVPTTQVRPTTPKKDETTLEEIMRGMRDLSIKLARLEEKASGDGRIALRESGEQLKTNFNKGGMKKVVEDYLAAQAIIAVEAACYGIHGCVEEESLISDHVKSSDLWSSALSLAKQRKMPREVLLRMTSTIRQTTGWDDPMETLSVHAYIAKSQHEALVEEKRRREDVGEGTSIKRQTRSDNRLEKSRQDLLPTDVPMVESTSRLAMKEKAKIEEKDTIVSREEEEELAIVCHQSAEKGKNLQVRWADDEEEEGKVLASHFTQNYWARGTTKTLVRLEGLDELVVALIDSGSEINIVSKNLYKKAKWPISTDHGWMVRGANNARETLYGACPDVKVKIGDVVVEQNLFVQETSSYPMILGQPFIVVIRMEMKVLDDGSAYARIRSQDEIEENIEGVYEEVGFEDILEELGRIGTGDDDRVVQIHSRELYSIIETFKVPEVLVETKYKTVAKKVKPVAILFPSDSKELRWSKHQRRRVSAIRGR
ncbi:hypothetical protein R1flu_009047 [Riccia fluitans]|uniref:Peptidase A2 domain-containing protein n=1 Tax=Riccia fluitans TaxID=41844 RepID=A0ABD1Z0Y6_9MARC